MRRLSCVLVIVFMAASACADDEPAVPASAPTTATAVVAEDASTTTSTTIAPADVPASPTSGCSAKVPVQVGDVTVDFPAGEESASYIRHLPTSYVAGTPVPLVMELHGYSEPADVQERTSQLAAYGDTAGFATVLPQVDRPVPRWGFSLDDPDLGYLGSVLDDVGATSCIDANRVFLTGFSNGALMTSSMVCRFADRIAAAAPVAGIRTPAGCEPSRSVPVITFHGTADGFVAYDGGFGESAASLPSPDGKGTIGNSNTIEENNTAGSPEITAGEAPTKTIADITAAWAERNGCDPTPNETKKADDVTLLDFSCPTGADAELYRVEGGGHSWPGSEFTKIIENVVGPTTFSIDATKLMWEFFAAHPLRD